MTVSVFRYLQLQLIDGARGGTFFCQLSNVLLDYNYQPVGKLFGVKVQILCTCKVQSYKLVTHQLLKMYIYM